MPESVPRSRNVFRACVVNAVREGEALMAQMVESTKTALEEQESGTRDMARRNTASDALRLLRQHEAQLIKAYPMALLEIFAEGPATARQRPANASGMDFGELSLVDDAEVQAQVELSRAQQLAIHTTDATLSELNGLVSAAQGLYRVQPERNPLRPENYIRALQQVVADIGVPTPVRDAWMQHMRELLGPQLVGTYQRAAHDLRGHGIAPVGYGRAGGSGARGGSSGYGSSHQGSLHTGQGTDYGTSYGAPTGYGRTGMATGWSGDGYGTLAPGAEEALLTVGLLRQMLAGGGDPYEGLRYTVADGSADPRSQGPRSGAGGYHSSSALVSGGQGHYPTEAAQALEDIAQLEQLVGRLAHGQSAPVVAGAARPVLQSSYGTGYGASTESPALAAEVVAHMVETIAQDLRLLPPVQRAVQNLEPAIRQLVRHDAQFFNDHQHPARRLLDELTQRSLAFQSEDAPGFSAFMRLVNEVVGHLSGAQITNGEPFEAVLKALHTAWDAQAQKQEAQRQAHERQLLQAEQRELLAEKIATGIRQLPGVEQVPRAIMDFACGPWAQVAALAQVGSPGADPGDCLALLPELFWSAQPQLAGADKMRLAAVMPYVLATLRAGLQTIAYPQAQTNAFMVQLAALHQQALDLEEAAPVPVPTPEPEPVPVPVELQVPEDATVPSAPERVTPTVDTDDGFVVGAWLELTTPRKVVRTQLTWTSPQKTLFLFTGADGSTQSMTRRMRDKLAADGALRVVPAQPVAPPPPDKRLRPR